MNTTDKNSGIAEISIPSSQILAQSKFPDSYDTDFVNDNHLAFYFGEVEVKIIQFSVALASPLQMRPLYHAEKLSVLVGNELMLTCRVKGRPTPLISWYVNSTRQLGLWDASTGRGVIHTHR
ncbi:unnamed protein product [Schistocephalus solidus]|uniref:Ig-like domain-containing protein n=1 Tax=Schistocephalus solidus TaxID=70667 RepID=A0A183T1H1_SCHSO|nr:unnamed protein product [Schistocephalus solidus]